MKARAISHFAAQLGEREARALEGADRLAEGLALAHVLERPAERRLRRGDGRGGDREALLGEVGDEVAKALALLAEQVLDGHVHVGEGQLGGVLRVLADLLEVAPALEALHAALDDSRLMPRWRSEGSVLTAVITRSALMPLVMNVFEPSTT